jgi:hypothetical protein
VDREDVGVGFLVFELGVALVGVGAEAARVHGHHVDAGFALHDPLGELPTGTAGSGDAEAVTLVHPVVLEPVGRADHRTAVGGVGNRPVDHVLDPHFAEDRHPLDGRLDVGLQTVQVAGEEVLAEGLRHPVHEASRRALLVGTEDQALALFAHVVGGIGFAQHRHLGQPLLVALDQCRVGLGDDVLMLDRDHRQVETRQGWRA